MSPIGRDLAAAEWEQNPGGSLVQRVCFGYIDCTSQALTHSYFHTVSVWIPWTPRSITRTAWETLSRDKDQAQSSFKILQKLGRNCFCKWFWTGASYTKVPNHVFSQGEYICVTTPRLRYKPCQAWWYRSAIAAWGTLRQEHQKKFKIGFNYTI